MVKFDEKFSPKPPNGIGKHAQFAYRELVGILKEEQRLFRRDLPVILQYAHEQGMFLKLQETVNKSGYKTHLTKQGGYSIAPELQIMQRCADNAREILTSYFKLGHSARTMKEHGTESGGESLTQTNRTPEQTKKDWVLNGARNRA